MAVISKPERVRYPNLDLTKGFLSIKFALFHLAFFTAVPQFTSLGYGQSFNFPTLLFAFGVGLALSKRRKPIWPLALMAAAYLIGSMANEAVVDLLIASGLDVSHTPNIRGTWERFISIATLSETARLTDFLQPYIFFYGLVLATQAVGRPLGTWSAWSLGAMACFLFGIGTLLLHLRFEGPLSALWSSGFYTFQYAPVFFAGMAFATLTPAVSRLPKTKVAASLGLILKLLGTVAIFVVTEQALLARGVSTDWHRAGVEVCLAGIAGAILLIWSATDVLALVGGPIVRGLQRIGRRMIVSLCSQMLTMPILAAAVLRLPSFAERTMVGALYLVCLATFLANWDWIVSWVRSRIGLAAESRKSSAAA